MLMLILKLENSNINFLVYADDSIIRKYQKKGEIIMWKTFDYVRKSWIIC